MNEFIRRGSLIFPIVGIIVVLFGAMWYVGALEYWGAINTDESAALLTTTIGIAFIALGVILTMRMGRDLKKDFKGYERFHGIRDETLLLPNDSDRISCTDYTSKDAKSAISYDLKYSNGVTFTDMSGIVPEPEPAPREAEDMQPSGDDADYEVIFVSKQSPSDSKERIAPSTNDQVRFKVQEDPSIMDDAHFKVQDDMAKERAKLNIQSNIVDFEDDFQDIDVEFDSKGDDDRR